VKTNLLITDRIYNQFRKDISLKHILPCLTTIKKERKIINEIIRKEFCIQKEGSCVFMKIYEIVKLLESYDHLKISGKNSFKITTDGSPFHKRVICTLNIINSSIFPHQSRNGCIPIAIIRGNENKEAFEQFKSVFRNLEDISDKYNIFLVCDLKALSYIAHLYYEGRICVYCDETHQTVHTYNGGTNPRTLNYILPCKGFNVIICLLHLKMRIMGNIIGRFLKEMNTKEEIEETAERIRKLPNCSKFNVRYVEISEEDDENYTIDQTKLTHCI